VGPSSPLVPCRPCPDPARLLWWQLSPLVAHCPSERWEAWLAPLVPPVLVQAHSTLAQGWAQLTTETGGAALPPVQGAVEEILHDKMLRDLSRYAQPGRRRREGRGLP
jgi:hypothetical protein